MRAASSLRSWRRRPIACLGVEIADQLYTNREGQWTNFTLVGDVLAHTTGPTAKILTSLSDMDAAQEVPAQWPGDGQAVGDFPAGAAAVEPGADIAEI